MFSLMQTFMQVYPQFAEKEQHGGFQQQDADECFQNMLATIEPALKVKNQSLIDKMFSFEIKYKISNAENSEEPDSFHFENMRKLSCIIDNQNIPINMLSEGIQAGLVGEIEKYSDLLERNAIFHRKGEIASLPDYLIIQKIRFIWKDSDNSTKNKATKAKVLRQVIFPRVLDIAPFCTDELKSSFIPLRESDKKKEAQKSESLEAEFEEYKKQFTGDFDSLKINKKFRESKKEQEIKEHDAKLWADLSQGKPNGNYELVGVITHKGRSADSGHYVGWTQDKGGISKTN
jgi:ubiquitin carboxyl-terminal hydrolase 14